MHEKLNIILSGAFVPFPCSALPCLPCSALIYAALRHQRELTGQRGVDVGAVAAYVVFLPEYVPEMF